MLGSISIREVADPSTAFEPSRPPEEGQRFVVLDVACDAGEDAAPVADPPAIFLVDGDGFLYRPSRVSRPAGEPLQDLEPQPLSPGDRVSGAVGSSDPVAAGLMSVVYAPASDRVVPIVGLQAPPL